MSTKKRCTTWALWVKFYLVQNKDCSPGDSTSVSSERLLQKCSGGRPICDFWEGVVQDSSMQLSTHFTRFSASHEELMKGFSAFLDIKRCKDWDHEISSWKYLKTCSTRFPEEQVPHFTLNSLRGVKVNSYSNTEISLHRGRW